MDELQQKIPTLLGGLLRSIARLCLRRGVKIQDFLEAVKCAFVDAAGQELERSGSSVSVSRVAIMTGLQRRDVTRRLRKEHPPEDKQPFLMKLIGQWSYDKRFCSSPGVPRPLTLEGTTSEFVELVNSVSKDVSPYTALFELERIEAIKRDGAIIELTVQTFEPHEDAAEALGLLASDMDDLVEAVEENLNGELQPPNLHIRTEYDNVCQDAIPEIRMWFLERGAKMHAEARNFLSQFDKDLNPKLFDKKGGARVVIGGFSRVEGVIDENDQGE